MAYLTYTTEAIVCGTFNRNTADRSYQLFTREAGMLYAEAKSVREERSRQRMSLQDFSYVRVSLVKGKRSWKIGSIEPRDNFFMAAEGKAARGSVVTLIKFIRRFYGGEEPVPQLFDYLKGVLSVVVRELPAREIIEQIAMARILGELGYIDTRLLPEVVQRDIQSIANENLDTGVSALLAPIIDKAVSSSQL